MSDFDEELDAFASDSDESPEGASPDPEAEQSPAERKAHLESLVKKGGVTGLLAGELLAAIVDREQAAERDRLAAVAEAAIESGVIDYDDPVAQEQLLARVSLDRQVADAQYLARRREALIAEHGGTAAFPSMLVESLMSDEVKALAAAQAFRGEPKLSESAEYQEYQLAKIERAREVQVVADIRSRSRTLMDDLADAQEGMAATLEARA